MTDEAEDDPIVGDKLPPPHSEEAERHVIGACLLDVSAVPVVAEIIRPRDFYMKAHRFIWDAILERYNHGDGVDAFLIAEDLGRAVKLSEVGGRDYIATCVSEVPHSLNAAYYARIVAREARRRSVLYHLADAKSAVWSPKRNGTLTAALAGAEENALALDATAEATRVTWPAPDLCTEWLERLRAGESEIEIPTGFSSLDRDLRGFHRQEFVIIGGRTSHGKSSLALQIALAAAAKVPVVIFALEDQAMNLMDRAVAQIGHLDLASVRARLFPVDSAHARDAEQAGRKYGNLPVTIEDRPGLDLGTLSLLVRQHSGRGAVLFLVDYLQLVTVEARKGETREREVARVSSALKTLARSLNVAVIACCQLNRRADERDEAGAVRHPRLTDIRESGQVEQDADCVLLVSRPEFGKKEGDGRKAILCIAKQRHGPTVEDIGVWFDMERSVFREGSLPRELGEDDA